MKWNDWFVRNLRNMAEEMDGVEELKKHSYKSTPKLNTRILSSMSKRSVAAHPWHEPEIGIYSKFAWFSSLNNCAVLIFIRPQPFVACQFCMYLLAVYLYYDLMVLNFSALSCLRLENSNFLWCDGIQLAILLSTVMWSGSFSLTLKNH